MPTLALEPRPSHAESDERDGFVRRHADFVYRVCLRLLRHPSDAEDAAQAAFIACLRCGPAAERRGRGWIATVALNACRDWRRSEARRRRHEVAAAAAFAAVEPPREPDDEAAALALTRLDEGDRALLHLRFVEDLGFREIAEATGRPQKAIETRIRRLVLRLRRGRHAVLPWMSGRNQAPPRLVRRVLEAAGLGAAAGARSARRGFALARATAVAAVIALLALLTIDAALPMGQGSAGATAAADHREAPAPGVVRDQPIAYPGGMVFALDLIGDRAAFSELGIDPTGEARIVPAESAAAYRAIEAMTFADRGDAIYDPAEEAAFLRTLDPPALGILARVRALFAAHQLELSGSGGGRTPRMHPGWPRFGDVASAGTLIGQRLALLRERHYDNGPNLFTMLSIGGVAGLDPTWCSTGRSIDWVVGRKDVVVAQDTDEPTPLALDLAAKLKQDGEQVVLLRRGETYVQPLKPSCIDHEHGGGFPPSCAVQILRAELPPGTIHGPGPRGNG